MADKGTKRDDSLFPDTKYHGLLYQTKPKRYDDSDIAVYSRGNKKRSSKSPKRRSRLHMPNLFGEKTYRPNSSKTATTRLSANISLKENGAKVIRPPQPLLKDRFVKNTLIACAVSVAASLAIIPTAFAKQTTDIRVNDSGRVLEASTSALTVGEFLEDNKIEIGPDDILETSPDSPITDNMEIIIRRGMPVTIYSGRNSLTVNMVAGTVKDALQKSGVTPSSIDEIYPSQDTYIRAGMKIDHIVVQSGERIERRDISYEETEREDPDLAKGKTQIIQEGRPGELELTYRQIYKNGVVTSEELVDEVITKEPINQITAVGSYVEQPVKKKTVKMSDIKKSHTTSSSSSSKTPAPQEVDENGDYKVEVEITAYCSACNTGSKTASGAYPTYGTVAASPRQFKMGTKLYIPGYGYGVVQDTGGFPPGTIDVYLGEREVCTCVADWGSKYAKITVYK